MFTPAGYPADRSTGLTCFRAGNLSKRRVFLKVIEFVAIGSVRECARTRATPACVCVFFFFLFAATRKHMFSVLDSRICSVHFFRDRPSFLLDCKYVRRHWWRMIYGRECIGYLFFFCSRTHTCSRYFTSGLVAPVPNWLSRFDLLAYQQKYSGTTQHYRKKKFMFMYGFKLPSWIH